MLNKARKLYIDKPCYYSLFPLDYLIHQNVFVCGDFMQIITNSEESLTFNFQKDFQKVDYNKGYKKIYVCENIYNKIVNHLELPYSTKKYVKAAKRGKGEEIIEKIGYYKPKGLYKIFTIVTDNLNVDLSMFNEYEYWYELTLNKIEEIDSFYKLNLKKKEIGLTQEKPTLLLHSCCGPCSSYVLESLHKYFQITILYFNPNIYPQEEFYHRLEVQKEIVSKLGYNDINIILDNPVYSHNEYLEYIKGYEDLGEKSHRCYLCYKQRLERTASLSKNKYDYFTTTISISPHKVSKWLNEIGFELEKKYNVKFLYSDFKQENGYAKSIDLSKKYNLYRQDYCGCEFSKK